MYWKSVMLGLLALGYGLLFGHPNEGLKGHPTGDRYSVTGHPVGDGHPHGEGHPNGTVQMAGHPNDHR